MCQAVSISLTQFMMLFSARTEARPFLSQRPGGLLLAAGCVALGISTLFSLYWPFGDGGAPISGRWCGFTWLYCLVWFLIQDGEYILTWQGVARMRATDVR